tara:strand:- start:5431 stop:5916 length:486 start_codon:yes stop_codon:yes gene_type:complete
MKRLILVRHAKSSLNQPLVSDHQRILNESGHNESKLIGQYLFNNQYTPSHIISSTATRTIETANIIIEQLKLKNKIEKQSLIYSDSFLNILNLINNVKKQYKCIMLVGHNPTITQLINHITNVKINHMPTCGMGIIDFDVTWNSITENGKLVDFIWPDKLK